MTALQTEPVSWDTIQEAIHTWVASASGIVPQNVIWAQQGGPRPTTPWISLNITSVAEAGIDWTNWKTTPTFTFSDLTIAGVSGSILNVPAHGLLTGDGPIRLQSTGTPPAPLALATNYWIIKLDADHVQLASTYRNSVYPWDNSASIPITLSSSGTGTNKIVGTSTTERKGQGLVAYTRATWLATMSIQCFGTPDPVTQVSPIDSFAVLTKVMLKARTGPVISDLNAAGIGINDFSPVKSIGKLISMTIFEPRSTVDFKFFLAAQVEDYADYIARVNLQNADTGAIRVIDRPDT